MIWSNWGRAFNKEAIKKKDESRDGGRKARAGEREGRRMEDKRERAKAGTGIF